MKQRITIHLLLVILVLSCMGIFSTITTPRVHAQAMTSYTHTRAVTSACTSWQFDLGSTIPYTGHGLGGTTLQFTWNITVYALRDCTSGQYKGLVYAHVCLSFPGRTGWPAVALWNEWYSTNNYVGENETVLHLNNNAQTLCANTASWSVPSGGDAVVLTFIQAADGSYPAGNQHVIDYYMI